MSAETWETFVCSHGAGRHGEAVMDLSQVHDGLPMTACQVTCVEAANILSAESSWNSPGRVCPWDSSSCSWNSPRRGYPWASPL